MLSQERAINAIKSGNFKDEIVPVGYVDTDEGPRSGTTVEVLQGLKKVFKEGGLISAGTSSQMSDGASAVLIMSSEKAKELGVKPMAKSLHAQS